MRERERERQRGGEGGEESEGEELLIDDRCGMSVSEDNARSAEERLLHLRTSVFQDKELMGSLSAFCNSTTRRQLASRGCFHFSSA